MNPGRLIFGHKDTQAAAAAAMTTGASSRHVSRPQRRVHGRRCHGEDVKRSRRLRSIDALRPRRRSCAVECVRALQPQQYAFAGRNGGGHVRAKVVEERGGDFVVTLDYERGLKYSAPRSFHRGFTSREGETDAVMEWGCYRGSKREWRLPNDIGLPAHSEVTRKGFMEVVTTSMPTSIQTTSPSRRHDAQQKGKDGVSDTKTKMMEEEMNRQSASLSVRVPGATAPLTLAFEVDGLQGAVPVGMARGRPMPLGVSLVEERGSEGECQLNFAVASHHAERMALCFVHNDGGGEVVLEIELDAHINKTGDVWHVSVARLLEDVAPGDFSRALLNELSWGWRARGPISENGPWLKETEIALDPYAREVDTEGGLGSFRPILHAYAGTGGRSRLNDGSALGGEEEAAAPREPRARECVMLDTRKSGPRSGGSFDADRFTSEVEENCSSLATPATAVLLPPLYSTTRRGNGATPASVFCRRVESSSLQSLVKKLHDADLDVVMEFSLAGALALCPETECGVALVISAVKEWAQRWGIDGFCFTNDTNELPADVLTRLTGELSLESSLSQTQMFFMSSDVSCISMLRKTDASEPSVAACTIPRVPSAPLAM